MSSSPERFKNNFMALVEICEELVQDGHENGVTTLTPVMFSVIRVLISKFSGEYLIERFISKTHNHWSEIKNKDFEYFKNLGGMLMNMATKDGIDSVIDKNDSTVISGLKIDHLSTFKDLLVSKYEDENGNMVSILDDDRISDTWRIMHSFVKQSVSYIHEKRCVVDGEYTKDFFSEINIKECAKEWNLKKYM
jgi:hypothetical protein